MENEVRLNYKNFEFRPKRMNAIEVLAIRSQISNSSVASTEKLYNQILERIEVKVKDDNWIAVKQGENFYPSGIENDLDAIDELITWFLSEYLRPVFQKSNG